MKSIGQYLLGILFIVLIVELVLIGPAEVKDSSHKKSNSTSANTENSETDESVTQVLTGIHAIEIKSDKKEWELWAEKAKTLKEKGNMALNKVRASFFSDEGVKFDVTGESGLVTPDSKDLFVDGGVVTTSSNGYVFRAHSLQYNSENRTLKSPSAVQVSGPRDAKGESLFISGLEMDADLKEGIVVIDHDVQARKTVSKDKTMSVSADQVKLSGREKQLRFTGNVVINMSGLRILGPDALFKYNSQSKQLESIDLEGGVKVSDFSKWATSEKLSINVAKNEYVFNGKPRVVQDQDELRGDQIIFLNGGKKVQVQNAKIKVSKDSLKVDSIKDKK